MMLDTGEIYYKRRHEIDVAKWDQCIDKASNGLIYAYSFYLDHSADNWDALVLNDYDAVMPLPWRKKFGIRYVYPPPFTQQLGWFGDCINHEKISLLLELLPQHFKFGEYFLNYNNPAPSALRRNNYILSLNQPYTTIAKGYRIDLVKNLKRTKKWCLQYKSSTDYRKAIQYFETAYNKRIPHVTSRDYQRLVRVCEELLKRDMLIIREVHDQQGITMAIAALPKDEKRLYLLLSTTVAEGRCRQANHFLIDAIIKEFATQNIWLDFEGSDIDGISHFYKNFGTTLQPYFFYRWNKLPYLLRLIKEKGLSAR